MDPEHQLLARMGLDMEPVSGGCCGLASSWGFEQGHHEIFLQCDEQAPLPAVPDADRETIVIANGFSCKTQIEQGDTGRRALHVAQAIKMAREHGPSWRAARSGAIGAVVLAAGTGTATAVRRK
jgi:Fe-S oxidoreductase